MGCEKENCCKKERKHDMCDMTSGMMRMADKAWEELMLQKMKSHFEKNVGEKMNKLAAASVDASLACWQTKMEGMARKEDHKQKMKQAMMG